MRNGMTIGQIADRLGMTAGAIRYYERVGLLPQPSRTEAGYRLYGPDALRRLRLVKGARLLGLSLKETGELIEYALGATCRDFRFRLHDRLVEKISEIDQRILELNALKAELHNASQRLEKEAAAPVADEAWPSCQPCGCLNEDS